jgi:hypothetical protein
MAPPTIPNIPLSANDEHKDRLDFLWKVHGYTNDYIRFADTKAAFVAATVVALIGAVVASRAFDSLSQMPLASWPHRAWWAAIALAALLLSFMLVLFAIRPRLHSDVPKGFIFWDSVVGHPTDLAFAAESARLTADEMELNVSRHIYTLAGICKRKYYWTNLAIYAGTLGGVLAGAVIIASHIFPLSSAH